MFILNATIVLAVLCSFVLCPKPDIDQKFMSIKTFEAWQCDNLCKGMTNDLKVKQKCAEFQDPSLPEAYTEEKIKEDSGCKQAYVSLSTFQDVREHALHTYIGICYLSRQKHICISGAKKAEDALIWSRSYQDVQLNGETVQMNVCRSDYIKQDFWKEEEEGLSTSSVHDSDQKQE